MNEFKGTKEKWYSVEFAGFINIQDGEFYEDKNILDFEDVGSDIAKANALLISKAPEMLEMLKECYTYLPYEGVMRKKVKQLIKEATEL